MSIVDSWQYRIENWSIYFQGGVRRGVLIFMGICIVFLAPFYFFGQIISNLWNTAPVNPNKFEASNIVIAKNLVEEDLEYSPTQIAELFNGENALYLTVNNKINPKIGYFPFVYTLQVLDSEGKIVSQEKKFSYLLPNEVKYIVGKSVDNSGVQLRVIREPETQAILYNPFENSILKAPKISVKSPSIQILPGSPSLTIKALFKNEDQVRVDRVDMLYIVRDSRQSVVGIGEFGFNGLVAGEEREVTVANYPIPKDRVATTADIRWAVNYLDKNTISLR